MENVSPDSQKKIGENCVDIFREKIEKSWSSARVLQTTSNLIISCCFHDEKGKEMYQNVKRTCGACRAIVVAN